MRILLKLCLLLAANNVYCVWLQANLCYVDIDKQSSQFPEELPVFPHKVQFITEIRALLNKYKVPHSGKWVIVFICNNYDKNSFTLCPNRAKTFFIGLIIWSSTIITATSWQVASHFQVLVFISLAENIPCTTYWIGIGRNHRRNRTICKG